MPGSHEPACKAWENPADGNQHTIGKVQASTETSIAWARTTKEARAWKIFAADMSKAVRLKVEKNAVLVGSGQTPMKAPVASVLLLLWKEKSAIGGFRISRALAMAAMSLAEQQAALFAKLEDLGITVEVFERFSRHSEQLVRYFLTARFPAPFRPRHSGSRVLWIAARGCDKWPLAFDSEVTRPGSRY